jgi:beta-lactamase regulating signal transducer with metallopeptidase domain
MTLSPIIEMGWKSALIAGAALTVVALLRSRSAADRAAVLRLAVALLLLLPLVAFALPALQIETPAAVEPIAATAHPQTISVVPAAEAAFAAAPQYGSELLIALAYLAGVLAIGLRLATGLLTLRRWTARARDVTSPSWAEAFRAADAGGCRPRLLVSEDVPAPMSWGWRHPVILIDQDTLERSGDAEAVLAHELAHVARRDWAALILARAAVALFWFNPLVWLVEREVAQEAEEAADSHALRRVEPARYAQTLVTCAQGLVSARVPANSIAPMRGGLARRVKAILEGKGAKVASGSRWTRMAMIGCVGFAAPVAALKLIPAAPPAPAAPHAPAPAALVAAPLLALAAVQAPQAPARPVPPAAPEPPQQNYEMVDVEIDEQAIERAAEEAASAGEAAAAQAEIIADRAEREAERIAERAGRDAERIGERAARNAERIAEQAHKAAAHAYVAGAEGMMRGAEGMERGARQMDQAAVNLGNRDYREKQIAEQARRGRRITHQELIDSIPELRQGADEMRRGAADMRKQAEEMRRQGI